MPYAGSGLPAQGQRIQVLLLARHHKLKAEFNNVAGPATAAVWLQQQQMAQQKAQIAMQVCSSCCLRCGYASHEAGR